VAVIRGQVAEGNPGINVVGQVPADIERYEKESREETLVYRMGGDSSVAVCTQPTVFGN
jgi:hypothetical protein